MTTVPAGQAAWSTVIPIALSDFDLDSLIDAALAFITRTISWKFTSFECLIGVLTNEFDAGFLPINDATGCGDESIHNIRIWRNLL